MSERYDKSGVPMTTARRLTAEQERDIRALPVGLLPSTHRVAWRQMLEHITATEALLAEREGKVEQMREAFGSVRVFAQDCIENGHDRGSLANLYAIRDLCDAALSPAAAPKDHA